MLSDNMKNKRPLNKRSPAPSSSTPSSLLPVDADEDFALREEKEFFNLDYWRALMHSGAEESIKKAQLILSCLSTYCDKTKSGPFYNSEKKSRKPQISTEFGLNKLTQPVYTNKIKLLDAGSGAGEISASLHHCLSKTIPPLMLDFYCVEKSPCLSEISKDHNVECKNINADLNDFLPQNKNSFDLLLSFYSSWGYGSDKENKALLKKFYTSLRPTGLIVLELANEEWVRDNFKQIITYQNATWSKRGLDLLKVSRHTQLKELRQGVSYSTQHWQFIYPKPNQESQTHISSHPQVDKTRSNKARSLARATDFNCPMNNDTKTTDFITHYCLYSAHRVESMLKSTGFTDIIFFDSLLKPQKNLDKIRREERILVIARKPGLKKQGVYK